MVTRPDRGSPVPLYHQIVESLRYRIATGQLRPGDALPTLREAAARWAVNLHTVRRAYGELQEAGLITVRRPQGAVVATTNGTSKLNLRGLSDFLQETVQRARDRFGLTSSGLADLLVQASATHGGERSASTAFVECSEMQALDYAEQIMERWSVTVRPHCLDASDEPLPGPILSTFFHFNDVRRRWPHRHADMRFVPVTLDPTLPIMLERRSEGIRPTAVILAETSADRAGDALADVQALLPADRFAVVARVTKHPEKLLERQGLKGAVLLAPRTWARLDERARRHPAAVQLRYVIEPSALENVAEALAWNAKRVTRVRAV